MTATQQTPGPAVELIEHAAGIIVAKRREPNTAPYQWAGALWEAGMLQPPGHAPAADPDVYADNQRLRAERDNALNRLHTMTEVARGNKQHVAALTEVLERVEKFADEMANYCSPHGVATRYAQHLRAVLNKPTSIQQVGGNADVVVWAIRVTLNDGRVQLRHTDDPFSDRSVAEQFTRHARLGAGIASAEVVCRDEWHGPWTAAPTEHPLREPGEPAP